MCFLLVIATILLLFRSTRFIGYITMLTALELSEKELGYTETEVCLNDIIIILLFILFEVWNKFRKEDYKNDNADKRADM